MIQIKNLSFQYYKDSKKVIDDFVLEEVMKELELKIINETEAMELLNITSKVTLSRKIREYKAKKKKEFV